MGYLFIEQSVRIELVKRPAVGVRGPVLLRARLAVHLSFKHSSLVWQQFRLTVPQAPGELQLVI